MATTAELVYREYWTPDEAAIAAIYAEIAHYEMAAHGPRTMADAERQTGGAA